MDKTLIFSAMRKRHGLADGASVGVVPMGMQVKANDGDPHKFTARITTDSIDRQNEVVVPEGAQFGEFLKSGAIFWNHDYNSPVGFPDKDKRIERGGNYIEAGGIFMKRPLDWEGAFQPDFVREFVTQGVKAGVNPGVSIGFMSMESRRPSKADIQKYGADISLVHSKWKLLEFSIAPMQANQDAYVTAVGKGLIDRAVVKALGLSIPEPTASPIVRASKVIKCTLLLPERAAAMDVDAQVREAVYKRFGKVFA